MKKDKNYSLISLMLGVCLLAPHSLWSELLQDPDPSKVEHLGPLFVSGGDKKTYPSENFTSVEVVSPPGVRAVTSSNSQVSFTLKSSEDFLKITSPDSQAIWADKSGSSDNNQGKNIIIKSENSGLTRATIEAQDLLRYNSVMYAVDRGAIDLSQVQILGAGSTTPIYGVNSTAGGNVNIDQSSLQLTGKSGSYYCVGLQAAEKLGMKTISQITYSNGPVTILGVQNLSNQYLRGASVVGLAQMNLINTNIIVDGNAPLGETSSKIGSGFSLSKLEGSTDLPVLNYEGSTNPTINLKNLTTAYGIDMDGGKANINNASMTIKSSDYGLGVYIKSGSATFNNFSINVTSPNACGMSASGQLSLEQVVSYTKGAVHLIPSIRGIGVLSDPTGKVQLTDMSITVEKNSASTQSMTGYGIYADTNSKMILDKSQITVSGNTVHGAYAKGGSIQAELETTSEDLSSITVAASTIGYGINTEAGGNVLMPAPLMNVTGPTVYGLNSTGTSGNQSSISLTSVGLDSSIKKLRSEIGNKSYGRDGSFLESDQGLAIDLGSEKTVVAKTLPSITVEASTTGYGINTGSGGNVSVLEPHITVKGPSAYGLNSTGASGNKSSISLKSLEPETDASIQVKAEGNGYGVNARQYSSIDIDNVAMDIDGKTGYGINTIAVNIANDLINVHHQGNKVSVNGISTGYGINSAAGSTILLENSSIEVNAPTGYGIKAAGTDVKAGLAKTTFTSSSIHVTAIDQTKNTGYGVKVEAAGQADLTDSSIHIQGANIWGIKATGQNDTSKQGQVHYKRGSITVESSNQGYGISAGGGSDVGVQGVEIEVAGPTSYGIKAATQEGSGAAKVMCGSPDASVTITANASQVGYGIHVGAEGNATVNNSIITVQNLPRGEALTDEPSTLETAYGVYAEATGQVNLEGSSISAKAVNSYGINALGKNSNQQPKVTYTTGDITVTGSEEGYGIKASGNSNVTITESNVIVSGATSYGMSAALGEGSVGTATVTFDPSSEESLLINEAFKKAITVNASQVGYGIHVGAEGNATVNHSTITVQPLINDTNSTDESNTLESAYGIYAEAAGKASLEGSSMTVNGANSYGICATGENNDSKQTEIDYKTGGIIVTADKKGYGVYANSGSKITLEKNEITVNAATARGIGAGEGGLINLTDTQIQVSGQDSCGIEAIGNKEGVNEAVISYKDGTISLIATGEQLNRGVGARSGLNGKISLNNAHVMVTKADSKGAGTPLIGYGVFADNISTLEIEKTAIEVRGDTSYGVSAAAGGTATFKGPSTITVSGDVSLGIQAEARTQGMGMAAVTCDLPDTSLAITSTALKRGYGIQVGAGGEVTLNNSSVTVQPLTLGEKSLLTETWGVYATDGGKATLQGSSTVTVTGHTGYGAFASNTGYITLNETSLDKQSALNISTINDPEAASFGLYAQSFANIDVTNFDISMQGAQAVGVTALDGSTIQLNHTNIALNGPQAIGINLGSGSTVYLSGNSQLNTVSDVSAKAIWISQGLENQLNLSSSKVTGVYESVIHADKDTSVSILADKKSSVGSDLSPILCTAEEGSRVNFSASKQSRYIGDLRGSGDISFDLKEGSSWKVSSSAAQDQAKVDIYADETSWIEVGGQSTFNEIKGDGQIILSAGSSENPTKVEISNYEIGVSPKEAIPSKRIIFNTQLGYKSSNMGRMSIDRFGILNAALESQDEEKIPVEISIYNEGKQHATIASQQNPIIYVKQDAAAQLLGNQVIPDFKIVEAIGFEGYHYQLTFHPNYHDPLDNTDVNYLMISFDLKTYNEQMTALYAALPSNALASGLSMVGTFHERMGGRTLDQQPKVWSRLVYEKGQVGKNIQDAEGKRSSLHSVNQMAQMGIRLYHYMSPEAYQNALGFYASIGNTEGKLSQEKKRLSGKTTVHNYATGLYWTGMTPQGSYLDGVFQVNYCDAKAMNSQFASKTDGWGVTGSLEGGVAFAVASQCLFEPQAQLIYQIIDLHQFNDGYTPVQLKDVSSLMARVGARVANQWNIREKSGSTWMRISGYQEFLGTPYAVMDPTDLVATSSSKMVKAWTEFSIGIDADLTSTCALYGSSSYSTNFSSSRSYDIQAGIKWVW